MGQRWGQDSVTGRLSASFLAHKVSICLATDREGYFLTCPTVHKGQRRQWRCVDCHLLVHFEVYADFRSLQDGVTIAICLREAGKDKVSAASQAFQEIRYDRVCAVQKTGETTRDVGVANLFATAYLVY